MSMDARTPTPNPTCIVNLPLRPRLVTRIIRAWTSKSLRSISLPDLMPGLLVDRSSTKPCGGLAMPKDGQWGSIEVAGGGGNGFAFRGAAEAIVRVAPP